VAVKWRLNGRYGGYMAEKLDLSEKCIAAQRDEDNNYFVLVCTI